MSSFGIAPAWLPDLLDPAGDLVLRRLRRRDGRAWRDVRRRNAAWLGPWDATPPPEGEERVSSYAAMVRTLDAGARQRRMMPYALVVDGRLAGQVSVNNVQWGSARMGSVGYWIDRRVAGRGYVPRAVALVCDHALGAAGLHRLEVAVRPENSASLRVVEKLGLHEVGFAPRYLHIDGDWRDHRIYGLTREQLPHGGLRADLDRSAVAAEASGEPTHREG
ncbi:GNAT family N-acetyltransferase [Nocardioidaceae bacterium]|nr:GNAT family N-acetyltransferase [Nocardioidaceae bacterium]